MSNSVETLFPTGQKATDDAQLLLKRSGISMSVTELRGADLTNYSHVFVTGLNRFFVYDSTATGADNGATILHDTNGKRFLALEVGQNQVTFTDETVLDTGESYLITGKTLYDREIYKKFSRDGEDFFDMTVEPHVLLQDNFSAEIDIDWAGLVQVGGAAGTDDTANYLNVHLGICARLIISAAPSSGGANQSHYTGRVRTVVFGDPDDVLSYPVNGNTVVLDGMETAKIGSTVKMHPKVKFHHGRGNRLHGRMEVLDPGTADEEGDDNGLIQFDEGTTGNAVFFTYDPSQDALASVGSVPIDVIDNGVANIAMHELEQWTHLVPVNEIHPLMIGVEIYDGNTDISWNDANGFKKRSWQQFGVNPNCLAPGLFKYRMAAFADLFIDNWQAVFSGAGVSWVWNLSTPAAQVRHAAQFRDVDGNLLANSTITAGRGVDLAMQPTTQWDGSRARYQISTNRDDDTRYGGRVLGTDAAFGWLTLYPAANTFIRAATVGFSIQKGVRPDWSRPHGIREKGLALQSIPLNGYAPVGTFVDDITAATAGWICTKSKMDTIDSAVTAGNNVIEVVDGSKFSAGDRIMIEPAGAKAKSYEISSVSTNTLTLASNLYDDIAVGDPCLAYKWEARP